MLASLVVGVILGGYLFSDTQPRSFLALNRCEGTCLQANELLGLAASVGVQKLSALAPSVVKETDKTIVINHPSPQARLHYLVIPKRDLKNIAEFSDADGEYELSAYDQWSGLPRRNVSPFSLNRELILITIGVVAWLLRRARLP
jgi:hypothetical protein